jgi:nitrogen fixation NifU-like protein
MSYSPQLLQHFRNPQYVGKLAAAPGVYAAEVAIPSGDQVRLGIATENGCIKDIGYQVFGCPAMIASMSWLASELINKDYLQATKLNAAKINQALSLPPNKYRCALLAEQVLEKVLEEWYNA